uniref:Ig-like domain-containing protein n=1 Tax=Urocitellus parryii TaxID=9999 RepID=A0A8D2I2Z7_UROPR
MVGERTEAVVKLEPPWIQVLQEDNVTLKCQGTRNPENHSTQWFHNGSPIPGQTQPSYNFKAKNNNNGEYRCQMDQTSLSDPVHLDVFSGPAIPYISLPWYQITFFLMMGLLFAVDTGMYFSVRRDLQSSVENWRIPKSDGAMALRKNDSSPYCITAVATASLQAT